MLFLWSKLRNIRYRRQKIDNETVQTIINGVKLFLVTGDITTQDTDAIVNAANSSLMGGGGVDGAIHWAGGPAILEECREIVARQGRLPAGQAVITGGGSLKSRFVIHTVGPVWHGGSKGEAEVLAGSYGESLKLAAANNLGSVSFPSISTGAYGYPVDEAARVALNAVASFLKREPSSLKEVVFVLHDPVAFQAYAAYLKELIEIR
ncbi:MAG: O-acetyl-ADP-ribose deacetylase [Dehalococcoidia bacterium]|nr:O-acetyl-ADP-ribose deacetylase [Dehalococcoidia bacterium]MDZ4246021.1 O-acetyl-ADP-ribose deacetylase [Dehalococcoidia bacterium]